MDGSRILIIGAKGQLGLALQAKYPQALTADIDELDITDQESVQNYDWSKVDIVLNAAAYTNVDGAETAEGRSAAWRVNAVAVKHLAHMAWQHNLTITHVSTDYVFDGNQKEHDENESFAPLSVYGASKAAGDLLISQLDKYFILRTSWVIGEGKNFVRTMLELGKKGISPTVVADQIGRLTFTEELVKAIDHLLTNNCEFGTYNLTNSGEPASWAEITRAIFEDAKYNLLVTETTTQEYFAGKEGVAPRPLNSTLSLDKISKTGFVPTDWRESLKDYVEKELVR